MTDSAAFLAQHSTALREIAQAADDVYSLFHRLIGTPTPAPASPFRPIIVSSVEVAEAIARAARLLTARGDALAAVALTRVRLEQLIVASYLVHEDPDVALKPYATFAPIGEYRLAQAVLNDPFLAPNVQHRVDVEDLKGKALWAQLQTNSGFDLVGGKLQSKWTSLDVYSMALRRDALVASSASLISRQFPLASLYTSFYKAASSVIHADASALGPPFRGTWKADDGTSEINATAFWQLALPPMLVTYDLIQCYEAIRWSGLACDKEFLAIAARLG
jgi:hypothetical protein